MLSMAKITRQISGSFLSVGTVFHFCFPPRCFCFDGIEKGSTVAVSIYVVGSYTDQYGNR